MTTVMCLLVGAVAWVGVAVLVGLLLGGAIEGRNRQMPEDDDEEPRATSGPVEHLYGRPVPSPSTPGPLSAFPRSAIHGARIT